MTQQLRDLIAAQQPEFLAMLTKWIQVPSVKDEPAPGAPFGREVRRMLDMALSDAAAMGFPVRNIDGYAGDITLGEGADPIAVLAHLDVVPAGDGWDGDPFSGKIEGDRIIGRGTNDDKGPALAALFAMKVIREAGIPLKRPIRMILGCDEESGWECMTYYAAHADMPRVGFSPDATYPVINTEKAMMRLDLRGENTDGRVLYWATGSRPNVIPGHSALVLKKDPALKAQVQAILEDMGEDITLTEEADGYRLSATGKTGHAAFPELGKNAVGMLLTVLRRLGVTGPLGILAGAVGMEYDGASLGIKGQDELSGHLTCNLGIIRLEEGTLYAVLDCRCPVTADLDALYRAAQAHLPGMTVEMVTRKAGHHVPETSELVQSLLAAYHEETGLPKEALAIGGGTYARVLQEGVAFGACFPGDPEVAHQTGEYMEIPVLMKNIAIFVNALLRLAA